MWIFNVLLYCLLLLLNREWISVTEPNINVKEGALIHKHISNPHLHQIQKYF
jgi:hypothetical protein